MQDFTNYTPNPNNQGSLARTSISSEAVFFQKVYTWMFAGLAITAGMAYLMMHSEAWIRLLVSSSYALMGIAVVQIGLVIYLSARINHMTPSMARVIFLAYSAITGATFSVIGLIYNPMVIFKAFVTTSAVYGAMAIYGKVTSRSLQAWGSFLMMGLIGLIVASVVNMFIRSSATDFVICVVGVLVFAGLTAYDHQKLRVIHAACEADGADEDSISRVVIMGSLTLYLDFINLFLMLLRLFGRGND